MNTLNTTKEYLWCAKLTSKANCVTYEGEDDGTLEQLVLKRACLGAEVKENERNVVQVTSFDFKQSKVQGNICSLRTGLNESIGLSDITVFPPAVFRLVEGKGPVHLVANHMLLEEEEDDSLDDESIDEEMMAPPKGIKGFDASAGLEDDDLDEEDFDDDEDESDEEEETIPAPKERKIQNENKKSYPSKQLNKKEGKTPLQQKQNKIAETKTPSNGKKAAIATPIKKQKKGKKV